MLPHTLFQQMIEMEHLGNQCYIGLTKYLVKPLLPHVA